MAWVWMGAFDGTRGKRQDALIGWRSEGRMIWCHDRMYRQGKLTGCIERTI